VEVERVAAFLETHLRNVVQLLDRHGLIEDHAEGFLQLSLTANTRRHLASINGGNGMVLLMLFDLGYQLLHCLVLFHQFACDLVVQDSFLLQ
jgi:hypothetical protein